MTYERFFSQAAEQMRESAIRKMGTLGARIPDLISFAPGYPDPATFPWEHFREIAASLLTGTDGSALQYGPTRGFRPLVEALETVLEPRGIRSTFEQRVITSGSQQGLDLVATVLIDPGDAVLVELPTYTGAISAFRNALADLVGVPQEADGIDLHALDRHRDAACAARGGACGCCIWCRTSRTRPGCSSASTSGGAARMGRARRRPHRRRRPVRRPVFSRLGDGRRDAAAQGRRPHGPGDLLVEFLEDPGARVPNGLDRRARGASPPSSTSPSRRPTCAPAHSISASSIRRLSRGVLASLAPHLRAHYQAKRIDDAAGDRRGPRRPGRPARLPRGGFFLWATLPPQIDADALLPRALANAVTYVAGGAFFVDGSGGNTLRLCFSQPTHDRIREGVARLAGAIRAERDAQSTPEPRQRDVGAERDRAARWRPARRGARAA